MTTRSPSRVTTDLSALSRHAAHRVAMRGWQTGASLDLLHGLDSRGPVDLSRLLGSIAPQVLGPASCDPLVTPC